MEREYKLCACGVRTLNKDMCDECKEEMSNLKQKKINDFVNI